MENVNFVGENNQAKRLLEIQLEKERLEVEEKLTKTQLVRCKQCGDACSVYYQCAHGSWCKECLIKTKEYGISGQRMIVRCTNRIGIPTDCVYQKVEVEE